MTAFQTVEINQLLSMERKQLLSPSIVFVILTWLVYLVNLSPSAAQLAGILNNFFKKCISVFITPQPLRAVGGYCFHPWYPDGRLGGRVAGRSLCGLYLINRKV